MAGKGDDYRPVDNKKFAENYDRIFKGNEMKNRQLTWVDSSGSTFGRTEYSEILVKIKPDVDLYAGRWVRAYRITEDRVLVEPPTERTDSVEFKRSEIEMVAFDLNDFPTFQAQSQSHTNDGTIEHWVTGERQTIQVEK